MADVSRETPPPAPPAPDEARGVFGERGLVAAQRYADALATTGVVRGLIGPREAPRLWGRHLLNSAVLAEAMPDGATVADVGSGAGLPGIPLAIARPDLRVTLIEPLLRRATFLQEVVDALELPNVVVLRSRGEDLHGDERIRPGFDVVTSRAVAALPQLLDWCLPLTGPSGAVVALKGASARDEIEASAKTLAAWGCSAPEVLELGVGTLHETTYAVRVAWADPSSVAWPPRRRARARPPGRRRPRR